MENWGSAKAGVEASIIPRGTKERPFTLFEWCVPGCREIRKRAALDYASESMIIGRPHLRTEKKFEELLSTIGSAELKLYKSEYMSVHVKDLSGT